MVMIVDWCLKMTCIYDHRGAESCHGTAPMKRQTGANSDRRSQRRLKLLNVTPSETNSSPMIRFDRIMLQRI